MYIELVVDNLYGPTPRLCEDDFQLVADMKDAKKKLDARIWSYNKNINSLTFDELMIIYIILIDNVTLFYRDQWRIIIREELFNKLKTSTYEIS